MYFIEVFSMAVFIEQKTCFSDALCSGHRASMLQNNKAFHSSMPHNNEHSYNNKHNDNINIIIIIRH